MRYLLDFLSSFCVCVLVVEHVSCASLELPVTEVPRPRVRRMRWSSIEVSHDDSLPPLKLLGVAPQGFTVDVVNNVDVFYSTEVRIGEPERAFRMLLDTGSSDFWVMQHGAEMINTVTNHNNMFYDVKESASGTRVSEKLVNITYGKGAISGVRTRDNMKLGGASISNQGFIEAKMVKDLNDVGGSEDSAGIMDGIWGMSFPGLAGDNFKPLIDTMVDQGVVEHGKFSFVLTGNGQAGSKLLLGEPDSSRMPLGSVRAPVLETPNVGFTFWAIQMEAVLNLGTGTDYCKSDGCIAIVDTGTTDFGMPSHIFQMLHSEIASARSDCGGLLSDQLILCEDSSFSGLPTFNFTIESSHFQFRPEDYMQRVRVNGAIMATPRFLNLGFTNTWILGGPWFRRVYTIFDNTDVTSPVVELANQSPPDNSLSMLEIFIIVAGCIAALCCVYTCVRVYIDKRRMRASMPALLPRSRPPEAVILEQSPEENAYILMEGEEDLSVSRPHSDNRSRKDSTHALL